MRTPAFGHLGERKACIHHQPCRLGALQELRLRHIAALAQLKKPFSGFFEATYLFTPDFEFGMTQSFSGQMDATSATQMARNPQNRGLLGWPSEFPDPERISLGGWLKAKSDSEPAQHAQ